MAEFEQFTVDAGCAPARVVSAHPADQVADFVGNRGLRAGLDGPSASRQDEKPFRCLKMTVSGWTIASLERQSLQIVPSQTDNRRSSEVHRDTFSQIAATRRFGGADPGSPTRGWRANGRSNTDWQELQEKRENAMSKR
jgi:hypothetical protein